MPTLMDVDVDADVDVDVDSLPRVGLDACRDCWCWTFVCVAVRLSARA